MKKKMDIQKEVSNIWRQAKQNIKLLGQRTLKLAERGEKEVVRASKIGKLQLDIVSINLKKENVFRQLGKRAYEMHAQKGQVNSAKFTSLFTQIDKLGRAIRAKKAKISKLKKS